MDSRSIKCGFDSCPACQTIMLEPTREPTRAEILYYIYHRMSEYGISFTVARAEAESLRDITELRRIEDVSDLPMYLTHPCTRVREVASKRYDELSK